MIRRKVSILVIQAITALIVAFMLLEKYTTVSGGLEAIASDVSLLDAAYMLFIFTVQPVGFLLLFYAPLNTSNNSIFALFYLSIIFVSICTSIILTWHRLKPLNAKYDRQYLMDILSSSGKDNRLYVTSKKRLAEKLLGEKPDHGELESIYSAIDEKIKPIKDFLNNELQESSILVVDSKWGTGKTTSVLVAIDETKNNKHNDKFLYESVFRYAASMDEFAKDFLGTLSRVLDQLGVNSGKDIDAIARNYEISPANTIINILKNQDLGTNFSIEIMSRINKRYEKSGHGELIFIIFDDLDRLRGEEIVRVLSLLSLLRHLSFVRIIIPADISMIARILATIRIPEPEQYIEKYLPEQTSVSVDLGYATTESVILTMLESAGIDTDEGCCPIWAAIIMNMLADILRKETNSLADHRGNWLLEMYKGDPKDIGWVAYRMLRSAPDFMMSRSGNTLSRVSPTIKKYYWDSKYNSIQNFENIFHGLRFSKNHKPVEDNFSYDDYNTLISPWIFEYAESHWGEFGFTMRKALDSLYKLKPALNKMPKSVEGTFAFSYNQFFPNKKITLSKISSKEGK